MKRRIPLILLLIVLLSGFLFSCNNNSKEQTKLSAKSCGIKDDIIQTQYGKRGKQSDDGIPTLSIPLEITSSPEGTVSYAIQMLDKDSAETCGYDWVQWTACNIKSQFIKENASINLKDTIIQGKNSFQKIGYGGPTPTKEKNKYEITIYALDSDLKLKNGFSVEQFTKEIKKHTIDSYTITAYYLK